MVGGMCGRGACVAGGMHCRRGAWMARGYAWHAHPSSPWQILRDTVNERAVRILLECILVIRVYDFSFFSFYKKVLISTQQMKEVVFTADTR